jgi:alpha-1,3-rhamnosyl/mannosyltransferase
MPPVLSEAFRVVTVSQFTKDQIIRRFRLSEEQVDVIPNAVSNEWLTGAPSLADRNAAIYLAVTGDAPSKNLAALLKAFRIAEGELPPEACLWIVGVPKARQERWIKMAVALGIAAKVFFYSNLTDIELMDLYDRAGSLVFPSLMEGFGIPLIEAMSRQLRIAASNTTAIPEVVSDAAVLFDPLDARNIASAIVKVGRDSVLREQLARCSEIRAQSFSHEAIRPLIKKFWVELGAL